MENTVYALVFIAFVVAGILVWRQMKNKKKSSVVSTRKGTSPRDDGPVYREK